MKLIESIPNITPHVCRHTYCSNMARSGMNPKTLQYLMGHSDIGVTLYGYIAVDDGKAIGFAYGYVLNEPDGRKTFYLHAIDIMTGYQNLGYGTELVRFVYAHSKSLGCRKMFLMTNTGNVSACRCYEKAGGISAAADVVMYEYKK